MKAKSKDDDVLYDPILVEVYRIRDAYARKFNCNIDAICDALPRASSVRIKSPRVTRLRSHRIPHG